ncbi:MAG: futalosine hydrolase [Bacteroidales bacterium]|nr:futalosine hydrolase [Bacteroidales bacterium]
MKRVLITAAEQEEITCAQQAYRAYEYPLKDVLEVEFMLTGIGTTSTCYRLTKKIIEAAHDGKPYNLVINIGIAGSYSFNDTPQEKALFPMGSTAVIGKEYFGDLGFETLFGFQTLFQYDILDADLFPFKGGALHRVKLDGKIEEYLKNYREGVGVTVQTVTGGAERRDELIRQFAPHIESMEGAAVYYVCLQEGIPFFELRTVSNEVGEKEREKWNTPMALESLRRAMIDFFKIFV